METYGFRFPRWTTLRLSCSMPSTLTWTRPTGCRGRPAATKQAAEALIGELRHGWDGTGEHGAALFVRQRDGLIGGVYLRRESHGVELGYGIAPEFRNQGFATRATRLVVDWLGPTGVPLSFRTSLTNHASRRVAEKLGFEAMRLDRRKTQSGEEYREAVYEWPDARQGLAPDRASR
jgi:RimJ/RimL family protein N-acetyltransferase